jgi:hypothetical protein
LFNKILEESREYSKAVTTKGEPFSAESLFMAFIFQQQQKMIEMLIEILYKGDNMGPRSQPIYLNEYGET